MSRIRSMFANIPPATKGLLIINVAMFAVTYFLKATSGIDLSRILALYYFESELFEPYQIVSHMFMHGGFAHLLFNMYALWLFGMIIERRWGSKRFLIYYFVTGLGALALHTFAQYVRFQGFAEGVPQEYIDLALSSKESFNAPMLYHQNLSEIMSIALSPVVGASGAIMGILLAFGMLYPNVELQLMFIPIPIKAKYFVMGYAVLELFLGVSNFEMDNIAHYAHLGGMLFGFIFIKIWGKDKSSGGHSSGGNFYKEY